MGTEEKQDLQKRSFRIDGMTCVNCQNKIEKKLRKTAGVHEAAVDYNTGTADVTYDAAEISSGEISAVIEKLGYRTLDGKSENTVAKIIGTLVIILALFMLMRAFGTSDLAASFPLAQTGMGYGMLLVIGILTSVHCIAMCGGINLSQTLQKGGETASASTYSLLLPSILYNAGRLVSYTVVGVVVGALGSVITVSGGFQGMVQLIAGIFMVIMGINMLGVFPAMRRFNPRIPKIFAAKVDEQKTGRGPLVIGLLNGLMPCGPLQAMQLYALSTGSPIRGGISMFLFCAGTIPLMFALGAVSSALSGVRGQTFSRRVMYAGAVLVVALGFVMFSSGWSLSGFDNPLGVTASLQLDPVQEQIAQAAPSAQDSRTQGSSPPVSIVQNGVQIINSTLQRNRYPAITVQQGIPVRWIINAPPGSITGCNNRMIIREYGIQYTFKQGDNVIEFTPTRSGRFSYSCWMAMIFSTITVLPAAEKEG